MKPGQPLKQDVADEVTLDLAWRVFRHLAYWSLVLEVAELSVAEEDEEGL